MRIRRWLSGKFAEWALKTSPNYKRWAARWGPEGFMVVPRAWVREEFLEADREWYRESSR
jgi:hypothetical protein